MIPLVGLGIGGLVWLAQKGAPAEHPSHPPGRSAAMSDALWRMLLEVLQRDLAADKLEALAAAFGRAHYHQAQQLLAARAAQARRLASRQQQVRQAIEGRVASEQDATVLLALADVLSLVGHGEAAARARARAAAAAQSEQAGDDLSELLGSAGAAAPADDDIDDFPSDPEPDLDDMDGADQDAAAREAEDQALAREVLAGPSSEPVTAAAAAERADETGPEPAPQPAATTDAQAPANTEGTSEARTGE